MPEDSGHGGDRRTDLWSKFSTANFFYPVALFETGAKYNHFINTVKPHKENDLVYLDYILIENKKYFWRNVAKIINEYEEHHYIIAELSLEKYYNLNPDFNFFNSDYDPPVYYVPFEKLLEEDSVVVDWCEKHGMIFD